MTAALEAGLEVGVYYFSHAYTEATAVQEAEWVINTLNAYGYTDWHLQAGIWYDYEEHTQLRAYINAGALTSQDIVDIPYCGMKHMHIVRCQAFLYGAHNMAQQNVTIQMLRFGNTVTVDM